MSSHPRLSFTRKEAAEMCGVSVDTIAKAKASGALKAKRLKLVNVLPLPDRADLGPGELDAHKNNVYVGTGSHAVELLWVQPQGKKPMRAADGARGVRIAPGERLGATDVG